MAAPAPSVFFTGMGVVDGDQLNTFVQVCYNYAQMRTFSGLGGMAVQALGATAPGDGGQGVYYYNSTSTAADNNSTVIVPSGNVQGAWIQIMASVSSAELAVLAQLIDLPVVDPGVLGEFWNNSGVLSISKG